MRDNKNGHASWRTSRVRTSRLRDWTPQVCRAAFCSHRLHVTLFDAIGGSTCGFGAYPVEGAEAGLVVMPPRKPEQLSNPPGAATISLPLHGADRLYRLALWLAFAQCLAQAISLPILITFDGYWYAKLAEVLGTSRFAAEWDYLRTPLFPLLLKLSFWLFGWQPLAVCALQSAFGFGGICLLGATIKRSGRPTEAAIVVVLLAWFPTLVTYEHALLTEAGTFFFLALLLYLTTLPMSHPQWQVAGLVAALALGFYHRSSLLYISPATALVYAVASWKHRETTDRTLQRRANRRILGEAVAVLLVPFLLAYPWQRNPSVTLRAGDVLLYGLVKQAVIPPDDALWANGRAAYRDAVDRSMIQGRLPLSGVRDQFVYPLLDSIHGYAPQAGSVFVRSILRYPRRYAAGCVRTLALFAGVRSSESDSAVFRAAVLSGAASISPHPPGFPPLDTEMAQHTGPSLLGNILARACPQYDRLVFFGVPATLLIVMIALSRKDPLGVALGAIPLAFLLLNALVLASQDRMAAPAYPLLIANLVLLPRRLWAGTSRGRAVRVALGLIVLFLLYPLAIRLVEKPPDSAKPPAAAIRVTEVDLSWRKRIDRPLLGYVERVGEDALRNGRAAAVSLSAQSEIVVEGWAVDQTGAKVGSSMMIAVNGRTIGCDYGKPRPDVAAALKSDRYTNSGYICHLPLHMIRAGENTLQVVLVTADTSYYAAAPITATATR